MAIKVIKFHPEEQEANDIAFKYINLKSQVQKHNSIKDKIELKKHEQLCIDKFKYIVDKRSFKYRKFSNYMDLRQDGFEALFLAMKSYNYNKGNFSWWADKYIATRISRSANAHSTIRIPIKKAKLIKPWKVIDLPDNQAEEIVPCDYEAKQTNDNINIAINKLDVQQQIIIKSVYGLYGVEPSTITKTAKQMNLSKKKAVEMFEQAKNQLQKILTESM